MYLLSKNFEKWIFIILGGMIWIYLWLKSLNMPMAHDEIASFFYFVHTCDFLPFGSKWEANNHILNSALTTLFYHLFGEGNLSLRLSNLVFFPLYAFYIYRISKEFKFTLFKWIFIISSLFAHYFIEFFTLSRGYGMSMALMTGAVFHLWKLLKNDRIVDYLAGSTYMALALLANLSLMNSALLFLTLVTLHFAINFNRQRIKWKILKIGIIVFLVCLPVSFLAVYSFYLKNLGLLYYGSTSGFFNVTIGSLAYLLTGSHSPIFTSYFVILFILTFFVLLTIIIIKRTPTLTKHIGWIFFLLLYGNMIATILLEKLIGVNYPEDRVGLYFYPLTIGSSLLLTDCVFREIKSGLKWLLLLPYLPLLILPFHMAQTLNLAYTFNYKNDYLPQDFYTTVKASHKKGEFPPTIGAYRLRHFIWSMPDFQNGGTESQVYYSSYPGLEADYQIANLDDSPKWLEYYDTISSERINNRYLLKRKHFLERIPVYHSGEISSPGIISDEYFKIFQGPVDSLAGKTIYISVDITIDSPAMPFQSWIVFNVKDEKRNDLRYECIPLDWMRTTWQGEPSNFMNGMLLHDLPAQSDKLLVYLWNIRNDSFSVKNGKVIISRLERDY